MSEAAEYNARQGYSADLWAQVQRVIGATPDGVPGPQTAAALAVWQGSQGLVDDGKLGPRTLDRLRPLLPEAPTIQGFARVRCTPTQSGHGYDRTTVRRDVAERLDALRDELEGVGAILTSAGGLRKLGAASKPGRASYSLHHLGLAHDLATYSGAQDPDDPATDPYIVTRMRDGSRYRWHVWARCEGGTLRTLQAVYDGNKERSVQARVFSLTEAAKRHGLNGIGSRSCYPATYGCAEWWHLQADDLIPEGATFRSMLEQVWSVGDIEGSKFAGSAGDRRWNGSTFR